MYMSMGAAYKWFQNKGGVDNKECKRIPWLSNWNYYSMHKKFSGKIKLNNHDCSTLGNEAGVCFRWKLECQSITCQVWGLSLGLSVAGPSNLDPYKFSDGISFASLYDQYFSYRIYVLKGSEYVYNSENNS